MVNGGIILTTPWPEMRIFKSKFLALRLQNKKDEVVKDIKKNKALSHLSLVKQSRLSVMPIDSKSWKILNKMGSI